MIQSKLLQVVFNADLRCSHNGLEKLSNSLKIKDISKLEMGEFVAFINSKKTMIKLYASNRTIAHYKMPNGQLNLKVLSLIPKFFNGRELKYDEALREVILKEIRK